MTDTDPNIDMTEEAAEARLTERLAERDTSLEIKTPTQERSVPGWSALLIATLLASALGAVGGWALSQNTQAPVSDATAALTDIQSTQSSLATRLDTLESRPVRTPTLAPDLTPLEERLDALEARPMTTVVATPAPTSSAAAPTAPPTPALTPGLARRLADMDKRLTALETTPATVAAATSVQTARPLAISTKPLPVFPLKAVEDALNTQRGSALGRVIGIRRAEDSDTLTALRTALDNQNISAALSAYDKLPEAAQTAAADWATIARSRLQTEDPR
jgi:hypothetical protein